MNKTKNFYLTNILTGIVIGMIITWLGYALWVGMGREIRRREIVAESYCETYGYCK